AAVVLTPRHRRRAWRSTSQGAGEAAGKRKIGERTLVATRARRDAGNPIVLHPLVPPHVDRHLGSPRSPRESLRETQIRRGLLEAGEFDLQLGRRSRNKRSLGKKDPRACSLHASH